MCGSLRTWSAAALLYLGLAVVFSPEINAQQAEPRPNANEQRILEALDDQTEIEMVDQPLCDVIEYLKVRHGIEIQLDTRALTDAGVSTDTPITRNIKGTTLGSALNLVLEQLDLTFLVHNEVLYITSKSHDMPITKVYPVGDLVAVSGDQAGIGEPSGYAPSGGITQEEAREAEAYDELIEAIASAVAPAAKDASCTRAGIRKLRAAKALSVTQTFQVHRQIERLLASIRAVKQQQASTPAGASDQKACAPARPKGKQDRQRELWPRT